MKRDSDVVSRCDKRVGRNLNRYIEPVQNHQEKLREAAERRGREIAEKLTEEKLADMEI